MQKLRLKLKSNQSKSREILFLSLELIMPIQLLSQVHSSLPSNRRLNLPADPSAKKTMEGAPLGLRGSRDPLIPTNLNLSQHSMLLATLFQVRTTTRKA